MKASSALLLSALPLISALSASSPPEPDRRAILSMAGVFEVDFEFEESVSLTPGYEPLSADYAERALEVVRVAEERPERITLQHLLVVSGDDDDEPRVIKHWAQVWTWEDTRLLDYAGSEGLDEWRMVRLTPAEAAGTWSQLVTNVDDTPRYEGYGKWVHRHGESSWTGGPTRRPLPRREHTKRHDYDYLLGTNRHTITADGWAHFQDNRKVIDRGEEPVALSIERGLNHYKRTEDRRAGAAVAWWEARGESWNAVRRFWVKAGERADETFYYHTVRDGERLSEVVDRLIADGSRDESVAAALRPFAAID